MIARPDSNIIEGTWEEVSRRSKELEGRRVRVVVLDRAPCSQSELRQKAEALLAQAEGLTPEPPMRAPTEYEQILIEKMRKQGIKVD